MQCSQTCLGCLGCVGVALRCVYIPSKPGRMFLIYICRGLLMGLLCGSEDAQNFSIRFGRDSLCGDGV